MTIAEAYVTLGLDASSTEPGEARSRFRDLIRANHPDGKPSNEQVQANEATRSIVEAYTLLRREGFPRLVARKGSTAASGSRYEQQTAAEPANADPLAWIDEAWRESVRTEPPETAVTKAILRTLAWAIAGVASCWIGIAVLHSTWWFGVLLLGWGARRAWAAWTMGCEVSRYWRVFCRVASPKIMTSVRRKIVLRVGSVIIALIAVGAYVAPRVE